MNYIKREDAEQILNDFINSNKNPITLNDVVYLLSEIHHIPDEDVRKNVRGEWRIKTDESEGFCTQCNYKIRGRLYQGKYLIVPYNFCPNCGADMKGESNEHTVSNL